MELSMHIGEGAVQVNDAVFAADFSEGLVHQIVTAYLAGGRAGTKTTKNRSAVAGGGRKPWRQKGTGRARAGTIRSPIWRGGGHTFAFVNRDHSQKVNKKMYRAGMRSILSELNRSGRLRVVPEINLPEAKTKAVQAWLGGVAEGRTLVVDVALSRELALGGRNIPHLALTTVDAMDPVSLVGADTVVITQHAAAALSEKYA
nr:50S ribosomal protein L4 [Oceanococcus sp. HetDA_MAG_MS8]